MKSHLFINGIDTAQAALARRDRVQFVASVRVAQSALKERPRWAQLLENSITHYPDEMSARILRLMARRVE